MLRWVPKCSFFLGYALLGLSCTRLPQQGPIGRNVFLERLEDAGIVPAGYGRLVNATAVDGQNTQLFFEAADGTIRVVFYQTQVGNIRPIVHMIRRQ